MYTRVMSDARAARQIDPDADMSDVEDKLTDLLIATEWPLMRERILQALESLGLPGAIDVPESDITAAG